MYSVYIFPTYQQIAKALPLHLVTETCSNFCTVPWEKKDKSEIDYFIVLGSSVTNA